MMRRDDFTAAGKRVIAVLGPTNTGKTHLAFERMLGHRNGIIGLPLRLLAREIYDRAVAARGRHCVALITGEEKVVPPHAAYFVCTVEAMPLDRRFAFLAVDEIQLAADPERGHVFTDRLLNARGDEESMFLGSDTIRPIVRKLIPEAEFIVRPRLSKLTYGGTRKLSRLPPRSAIVAFTANDVYAIAELLRRYRGGAAVVLGALSPRSRNAQVALFEDGDVDYMVATDAIGMGLNLSVDHVAFAALGKFDGWNHRPLQPAELGQIAGRAGRHMHDGSFGCTADAGALEPEVVAAIENHRFSDLKTIFWRESRVEQNSLPALISSLERRPSRRELSAAPIVDDLASLRTLAQWPAIVERATTPAAIRLLWEVCQIPDYRKTMAEVHTRMLSQIYRHLLSDAARIPTAWLARHVDRLDRIDGDIDALATRVAHIRTWTYVSHRAEWIDDPAHWQQRTRAIEDRLSDALHDRLTRRFVDRRSSTLTKRLRDRSELIATVGGDGEVLVEGHSVGRLDALRFVPESDASNTDGRTLHAAAMRALAGPVAERARVLAGDDDNAFALQTDGRVAWRGAPVAMLSRGPELLKPQLALFSQDLLHGALRERVQVRLERWMRQYLVRRLAPLWSIRTDDLAPPGRGLVYQLVQSLGCLPNGQAGRQLGAIGAEDRRRLRCRGVKFGVGAVYVPAMLRPERRRLMAQLWHLRHPEIRGGAPDGAAASVPAAAGAQGQFHAALGFIAIGPRAIRIDLAERLRRDLRDLARSSRSAPLHELMARIGCPRNEFPGVLAAMGFKTVLGDGSATIEALPRVRRRTLRRQQDMRRKPSADSPFAVLSQLRIRSTRA